MQFPKSHPQEPLGATSYEWMDRHPLILYSACDLLQIGNCLYVTDTYTKVEFLIDMSPDVSLFPLAMEPKKLRQHCTLLQAVNVIQLYSKDSASFIMHMSPEKKFEWKFLIAVVLEPIIGIDFLTHHGLSSNVVCCTVYHHQSETHFTCSSVSISTCISPTSIKLIHECSKLKVNLHNVTCKWSDTNQQMLQL